MNPIRHDFSEGQITALVKEEISKCDEKITGLLAGSKEFSAFELYDAIISDLIDATEPARFMFYVHTSEAIRKEAEAAEEAMSKYLVDLGSRRDIYRFLVASQDGIQTPVQQRFVEKVLRGFRKSGLDLPDEQLAEVTACYQRLSQINTQFQSNLNSDTTKAVFSEQELDGVPASLKDRMERDGEKYLLTTRGSDIVPFMQNAKSAKARRRAIEAYDNKAPQNTALLCEALELRKRIVALLSYPTWADFRTESKMAKNAATVQKFLAGMRSGLSKKLHDDIKILLAYKQTEEESMTLNPWDIAYCENQIMKTQYALDQELVRKYFPAEHVVEQMLKIFSEVLGVRFVKSTADAWASGVILYEIQDKNGSRIAHFYADMYPRDGKYNHAAAFTLRLGRMHGEEYLAPISAIVSNFTPPTESAPSLLTHDEVVTLFHEFGHIMHQTLTKAPYASLAGTNVARDFVETLSQLFENWAWDKTLLAGISRHYETGEPLPEELIDKMIATKNFNTGWFFSRQLLFGLYDLELHTKQEKLDPTQTYKRMYKEVLTIDPLPNTNFPAGFGHIIGGYDAGYYGYLWSLVYAQDMFTRFAKEGVLNTDAGAALLRVLQSGDAIDANDLLREYLGREPNNEAFLKWLGI